MLVCPADLEIERCVVETEIWVMIQLCVLEIELGVIEIEICVLENEICVIEIDDVCVSCRFVSSR